jgi:histidinol-phosphate phosphatase family protein
VTSSKPRQAAILCGGLGTRMRPYTDTQPKPMMPCNGKPFLYYLLEQLAEQGITRFVLLTGYLGEQIEEYFGDGAQWGWTVVYSRGPVEWDTGRRIWEAEKVLEDCFVLLYSDNFVPFPLDRVQAIHEQNALPLTFMASPKCPGNIAIDQHNVVTQYDNSRDEQLGFVEIGYMIVEKKRTLAFFQTPNCSFSSVLKMMASKKQISAWIQNDSYHSISDPERWKETAEYLKPKKIILIDRDGVINQKSTQGRYINNWSEFEWIDETRAAMRKMSGWGAQFIVITNQAGVGRGMVDPVELTRVHENMAAELAADGVEVMNIYVCPHHWDDGCSCRKPNPGLFYQASREYLFRLDKTLFIGDDPRDCQAAWNAGCGSVFLGNKKELTVLPASHQPGLAVRKLLSAVKFITRSLEQNL